MALAAIGISFAAAILTFAALNNASDAAKAHEEVLKPGSYGKIVLMP